MNVNVIKVEGVYIILFIEKVMVIGIFVVVYLGLIF